MATRPVTTWDVLDGHVTLDLQCLDRIYLNGYVPNLQVGGQIVQFLAGLGFPIPSPAVVARIGDRFRDAVRRLADTEHIPVVRFAKHARKLDVMRPHLDRQAATGRSGIAGIGVAQGFNGSPRAAPGRPVVRVLRISNGVGRSGGCRASTSMCGILSSVRRS